MSRFESLPRPLLAGALTLALVLVACNRDGSERTTGQKVDASIAKVDAQAEATRAALQLEAERARDAAAKAGTDATRASGDAAQAVAGDLTDSAITASVKAKLAADSGLASASVHVETASGRTALTGRVADAATRDRAGQLAASVKGVWSVDNLLEIGN